MTLVQYCYHMYCLSSVSARCLRQSGHNPRPTVQSVRDGLTKPRAHLTLFRANLGRGPSHAYSRAAVRGVGRTFCVELGAFVELNIVVELWNPAKVLSTLRIFGAEFSSLMSKGKFGTVVQLAPPRPAGAQTRAGRVLTPRARRKLVPAEGNKRPNKRNRNAPSTTSIYSSARENNLHSSNSKQLVPGNSLEIPTCWATLVV